MYIDSHCHLDSAEFAAQIPAVLERMQAAKVSEALCINVSLESYPALRALVGAHAQLFATVGVHPEDREATEPTLERLCELAADPKVLGIGETGLDYYWHKEEVPGALEWQRERFRVHIRAARATGKPLVVHTRNAAADTLRLLQEEGAAVDRGGPGGVMHCFTEDWPTAEAALALGFYISFSGIVTFKNAAASREVAARVPAERILIETDAPYLAPAPHRGKTNEPSYVPHVAAELARVRGVDVENIARLTTENYRRLFGRAAGA